MGVCTYSNSIHESGGINGSGMSPLDIDLSLYHTECMYTYLFWMNKNQNQ